MEKKTNKKIKIKIKQMRREDDEDDIEFNFLFSKALKNGDEEAVKGFIKNARDINANIQSYHTKPLHIACRQGSMKNVLALIDAGADTRAEDSHGFRALHFACMWGNLDIVEFLYDKGENLNSRSKELATPLILAAYNRQTAIVKFLVDKKAGVDLKNFYGKTALFVSRNVEIAIILIDAGADVNARDREGKTPLHFADSTGCIRTLVKAGADIDCRDNEGNTPLDVMCVKDISGLETVDLVVALLELGASCLFDQPKKSSPLIKAAAIGHVYVVKILMEKYSLDEIKEQYKIMSMDESMGSKNRQEILWAMERKIKE